MAVAASTHAQVNFVAATTNIATNITIGGSNLALVGIVCVSSATINVTSASWSLGGTPVQISSTRSAGPGNLLMSAWSCPAPSSGSGTWKFGFSASAECIGVLASYTGADQTAPVANADTATSLSVSTNVVLTPLNLTANDASLFLGANVVNGNWSSSTPTQFFISNSTAIGDLSGGATGTTGVHEFNDGGFVSQEALMMAIRIKAAAAAGSAIRLLYPWGSGDFTGGIFSNNKIS